MIKGEFSNWWNKEKITNTKFEWQDEYFCHSVSDSLIEKIRDYINNQEEDHRKKSFMDEYIVFKKKYFLEENSD